jgi:hypothetical protein
MSKLIVTADIHGSYSAWLTLNMLLGPNDRLVIAGDLFDTRYGDPGNSDFQPEAIRQELIRQHQIYYYVYGNCDVEGFFPGFEKVLQFQALNKNIVLFHGHLNPMVESEMDIVIQGHTHRCALEKRGSQVFLNPGTLACPRNGIFSYGVIEETQVSLVDLKTGHPLVTVAM